MAAKDLKADKPSEFKQDMKDDNPGKPVAVQELVHMLKVFVNIKDLTPLKILYNDIDQKIKVDGSIEKHKLMDLEKVEECRQVKVLHSPYRLRVYDQKLQQTEYSCGKGDINGELAIVC